MQDGASALKTAGNDIDESIAMIASANEIVQDPAQVGNAMKTLSLRILGNKSALEELGEETDNVADSTSELNKKMEETAGISILDDNGELKSTYKILDELYEKWNDLSSLEQSELTNTLAGKNRANVFAALMQNWDKAREAFDVSANQSAGSAEKEMNKALDSVGAKINQLKATGQSLSIDFLNSDSLKQALDIIIKLGSALDVIVKKVGALPTLVGAITAAFTAFGDKGFVKQDTIKSFFAGSFGNKEKKEKGIMTDSFTASLNSDISAINSFNDAIANGQGRNQAFESCLVSASNSAKEYAKSIADGALSSETFSKNMVSSQVAIKAAETAQGGLINRIRSAKSIINEYNNECKNTGMSQKDFAAAVGQGSSTWGKYLSGLNGAKASLPGYIRSLVLAKAKTIGLQMATVALNTVFSTIITIAVSKIISVFMEWINTAEETRQKNIELGETAKETASNIIELYDAYKLASEAYKTNSGSKKELESATNSLLSALGYEESEIESLVNKYGDLDTAINNVTQEALQKEISNLSTGYTSAGEEFYKKAKDAGNEIIYDESAFSILKKNGFDIENPDYSGKIVINFGELWDANDAEKEFQTLLDMRQTLYDAAKNGDISLEDNAAFDSLNNIINDLEDSEGKFFSFREELNKSVAKDQYFDFIKNNDIPKSQEEFDSLRQSMIEASEENKLYIGTQEDINNAITNTLSNIPELSRFIKETASDTDDAIKVTQSQMKTLRNSFKEQGDSSLSWFDSLSAGDKQLVYKISAETDDTSLWDLTKWEEELNHLKETGETTSESLSRFYDVMNDSDDGNFKSQIENSVDSITSLQDSLNKLDLGELSDSDLANLAMNYPQLAPYINDTDTLRDSLENLIDDTKSGLDDSFQSQIEELGGESTAAGQAMLELQKAIQAINDTPFDISKETQGIENYKTAVNESVAATGLSEDSIKKIQARYRSLDGYNPNKLFERTVNGIHLNVSALRELESEYKTQKKADLTSQLESMSEEYARLYKAMKNCTDTSKTIEYSKQLQELGEQIDSVSQLAAEYDGLTSSYNEWLNAQSTTDEDDMFSKISNGIENMQEQYDLGRVGTDDFRSWVQMMTNVDMATASIADLESMYERGTSTIQRFFTNDRSGLENFVNDVKAISDELGKNWVNIDKDGNYHIDFGIGGDEEVANMLTEMDNLQISTQQVQILMRALSAYGFDINLDSLHTSVSLLESANEKLKSLGKTSVTFDINTTDIDNVNDQIKEAQSVFDSFKKDDGTININADGAKEAETVLSALITRKQELENPVVMAIDTSQLNDLSLSTQFTNLKMLLRDSNDYELNVALGIDTSHLESEIQSIISSLQTMPTEMKAKLGLDDADFQQALANIQNTKLDVGAEVDPDDIATVQQTINSISKEQLVSVGVDESAVKSYTSTTAEQDGVTKFDVDSSEVDAYSPKDKNAKVRFSPDLTAVYRADIPSFTGTIYYNAEIVGSVPSGTTTTTTTTKSGKAHANGTAYAQGNWGTKDSGIALGGELGEEIIVRDGHWQTIGENGAEFFKYQRGDIIFNADQTESLLKYGKITSGNKRGSAYAEGTAFSNGSGGFGRKVKTKEEVKNKSSKSDKSSSNNKSSNSNSSNNSVNETEEEAEKFEETLDWIEIMINRIESAISSLNNKANSIYKNWSYRNFNLKKEIGMVSDEIKIQQDGYDRYMKQANSVGLSSDWAKKVREGKIDIEKITDEDLNDKIKEYQQWYEKAIQCQQAIESLKETESELYKNTFDNIDTEFSYYLSHVESLKNDLESQITQHEAKGYATSEKYYKALLNQEDSNLRFLRAEKTELQKAFDSAVDSGKIEKYSEAWYSMRQKIDEVTNAINKSNEATLEYLNSLRQVNWNVQDLISDSTNSLTNESDFYIKLLEDKKIYDDRGQFTGYGDSTLGAHAINYGVYFDQSTTYARQISDLDKELKKDPTNKNLIDRRKQLLELQQESILATQSEKQAIVDMVKEGIELELDYLQDLIDKYEDALDSQKDLYDYQQSISNKTSNISSLQKQLLAYQGDDSEETRTTVQKLKVSLEEAKQDLKDTEYDRYISDQKDLLDQIYNEYQDILNARLDNVDKLMQDMINVVNNKSDEIKDTLVSEGDKFEYAMTGAFASIFNKYDVTNSLIGEKLPTLRYNESEDRINESSLFWTLHFIASEQWDRLYYDDRKNLYEKNGFESPNKSKKLSTSFTAKKSVNENGVEEIITGDGQTLYKIESNEGLVNNDSALSLLNTFNNMDDILDDLSVKSDSIQTVSSNNNSEITNNSNVSIVLPNVMDYDDFKSELQKDKNFEKMIQAMTIDKVFGKGNINKYKVQ